MARREEKLTIQGSRSMNDGLAKERNTRTKDSIKSHRRVAEYKKLVAEALEQIREQHDEPDELENEMRRSDRNFSVNEPIIDEREENLFLMH